MNEIFKSVLLTSVLMVSMMSCNNEELYEEAVAAVPQNEDAQEVFGDASIPCAFALNNVEPNSTLTIDCILDLQGKTVTLPENVTIDYEGGDIINGTLNFSDNSTIDGNILNSTLAIGGSVPQAKNRSFDFVPSRWGIVEGKVSDDVARTNRDILENIMMKAKTFGISEFSIDKMDAYFNVMEVEDITKNSPSVAAINLPNDFHLIMSDNTHLRMQPNNYKEPTLLGFYLANNVIIEGGNLYGDRDAHDYSDGGSHEWGHVVRIHASKNITVKDMTIMDAAGDGIAISAYGHAYDPHYTYSSDVLITGNKFLRNRRLGMSITDGRDIVIDGNEFIDSGVSTNKSNGTAPQYAIDMEPVATGGQVFEIVENVIIRNNVERGSKKGGIIVARGNYITVENNVMENTIDVTESKGSIIRNNFLNFNPTSTNIVVAINIGQKDAWGYGKERNKDNQVYGNTITGYETGIFLGDPGIDLHSNVITDCEYGIQILNSRDSKVRDNIIKSEGWRHKGISSKTSDYMNNIDIYNNTIEVDGSPFEFSDVNLGNSEFTVTIRNNNLTSYGNNSSNFTKISGFKFKNNTCYNSGIRFEKAVNSQATNNKINKAYIRVDEYSSGLSIIDNTIAAGGGCFWLESTDEAANKLIEESNFCVD